MSMGEMNVCIHSWRGRDLENDPGTQQRDSHDSSYGETPLKFLNCKAKPYPTTDDLMPETLSKRTHPSAEKHS